MLFTLSRHDIQIWTQNKRDENFGQILVSTLRYHSQRNSQLKRTLENLDNRFIIYIPKQSSDIRVCLCLKIRGQLVNVQVYFVPDFCH